MAKTYEFKFDETSEPINVEVGRDEKGNVITEKKPKEDIEKMILKNIFNIAAAQQKEIPAYLECKDCISQIDNLKSGAVLLLTESDMKYIKEGFEKTAGNRPFMWLEYGENIFRQIKTPVEHKE